MWKRYFYSSMYSLVFLMFVSCLSSKNKLELRSYENTNSIVIRRSNTTEKIKYISIPRSLTIENKSLKNLNFFRLKYNYYKSEVCALNFEVYHKESRFSLSKIRTIKAKERIHLSYKTRHCVLNDVNRELDCYLEEMREKGQDTLHIGTVVWFKKKHPKLLNKLTNKDSISVSLIDRNNETDEIIRIQINY